MISPSQATTRAIRQRGLTVKIGGEKDDSGDGHGNRVELTLSPAQVGQVMRAVTGSSPDSEMLNGERAIGIDEPRYRELLTDRRLSRSLLSGLMILRCFQEADELGIADISRDLDMRSSTTHRYVITLLAAGLLERDPVSRLYRLAQP